MNFADAWIRNLKPKQRARLIERLDAEIALIEARASADEAERQAEVEAGERLDHERELALCASDIFHWVNTWVWTYNPKLIGQTDPATGERLSPYLRFKLWPKQEAGLAWIGDRFERQEEGVWEKSRDVGASYIAAIFSVHRWLFEPGFKASFTSRDADLVDTRDQPDSLFEKIRVILRRLPAWMLPDGFNWRTHDNLNRIINPANGALITGDVGDEVGRGGRSSIYWIDEAAFIKNAGQIERALSGNTDCIIWISSANGMGNLFYRKRNDLLAKAPERVFRLHYTDDPRKTAQWAIDKRESLTDETAWASEYEIDYAASVEGICIPAAWVQAAQQLAALEPRLKPVGAGIAGVDIGGGKAKSVVVPRHGPIIGAPHYRQEADTTETAYWALETAQATGCATLNFDAPGIGAGVASTLVRAEGFPGIVSAGINTGNPPTERIWPDGRTSKETFGNLKAELWYLARTAMQKTFWHVQALKGVEGFHEQEISELLSLPADGSLAPQLSMVKRGRNEAGKIVIETKQQLAKRGIPSPDFADALVLCFLEAPDDGIGDLDLDMSFGARENPWKIG